MSLVQLEPFVQRLPRERHAFFSSHHGRPKPLHLIPFRTLAVSVGNLRQPRVLRVLPVLRAGFSETPSAVSDANVVFSETFPLKLTKMVEGKVSVKVGRMDEEGSRFRVVVCCNLEGKWIMHWGVTYCDDLSSEWDQPPPEMRPPGSIEIKGYAIETPMKRSLAVDGQVLHEVHIMFDRCRTIAAINFVLREEENGTWFQHRGRDFKIQLLNHVQQGVCNEARKRFNMWSGPFDQISNFLLKPDISHSKVQESYPVLLDPLLNDIHISDFYEEYSVIKEEFVLNSVTITVRKSCEAEKNLLYFDTDIPGDVVIHWGVCRNDLKKWETPFAPFPPSSKIFRQKALQTLLQ